MRYIFLFTAMLLNAATVSCTYIMQSGSSTIYHNGSGDISQYGNRVIIDGKTIIIPQKYHNENGKVYITHSSGLWSTSITAKFNSKKIDINELVPSASQKMHTFLAGTQLDTFAMHEGLTNIIVDPAIENPCITCDESVGDLIQFTTENNTLTEKINPTHDSLLMITHKPCTAYVKDLKDNTLRATGFANVLLKNVNAAHIKTSDHVTLSGCCTAENLTIETRGHSTISLDNLQNTKHVALHQKGYSKIKLSELAAETISLKQALSSTCTLQNGNAGSVQARMNGRSELQAFENFNISQLVLTARDYAKAHVLVTKKISGKATDHSKVTCSGPADRSEFNIEDYASINS
jgi:hypothetical protein